MALCNYNVCHTKALHNYYVICYIIALRNYYVIYYTIALLLYASEGVDCMGY